MRSIYKSEEGRKAILELYDRQRITIIQFMRIAKMEIRLFDLNSDYDVIRNWITDERTHMLWCAGRIPFPMSKAAFQEFLDGLSSQTGDVPYIATDDDGKPAGFYTYSFNENTKEGMLKFVVVDPEKRGKGIAAT